MTAPSTHRIACFLILLAPLAMPAGSRSQATPDSLAPTPPMGWNSWNKFFCNVSEELIKSVADAIATNGMKDAGYQYVVIDDCWQVSRDASGNIVADPQNFPSGIKALADYVHSKGLKFGIYSDAGSKTCAGRPGSQGHEYQDAVQYALWGVDYLKYDWCNTGKRNPEEAYATMRNALTATGRPIVLSIREWGTAKPWLWGKEVGGNLWRTTGDISDKWESAAKWSDGTCCAYGMVNILDQQVGLESFAGPGHWNGPDMLEVGNGGMTLPEYRAHFCFWALLAAPLIAGNDVRSMTAETREILINKEVIAVDQDTLGGKVAVYAKMVIWKSGPSSWAMVVVPSSCSIAAPPKMTSPFPGKRSATPLISLLKCATSGHTKISAPSPAVTRPAFCRDGQDPALVLLAQTRSRSARDSGPASPFSLR